MVHFLFSIVQNLARPTKNINVVLLPDLFGRHEEQAEGKGTVR